MEINRRCGKLGVSVTKTEKVSGHCPSVDVLFETTSQVMGPKAIGIIMTGMGKDGAQGMLKMHQKGAYTIGQDEASSVVYGMPRAAYELGAVDVQAPPNRIPELLYKAIDKMK
jgi:two-component system chemotaxis response regulator CheB